MTTAARTARPFACPRFSRTPPPRLSNCANTSSPIFSHLQEHDPFEAAFARLLKDLKSDGKAND